MRKTFPTILVGILFATQTARAEDLKSVLLGSGVSPELSQTYIQLEANQIKMSQNQDLIDADMRRSEPAGLDYIRGLYTEIKTLGDENKKLFVQILQRDANDLKALKKVLNPRSAELYKKRRKNDSALSKHSPNDLSDYYKAFYENRKLSSQEGTALLVVGMIDDPKKYRELLTPTPVVPEKDDVPPVAYPPHFMLRHVDN